MVIIIIISASYNIYASLVKVSSQDKGTKGNETLFFSMPQTGL